METRDYYLGLDMGTSSVGWAVTDAQYQILRAKGKDLWGIREFEEAQTAVDRRTHRISRRRRQREQVRIGLLKSYFADEIAKIDPYFFQRLENSKYFAEDKDEVVKGKNGIFADVKYTDKQYYEQYPTIYHLRKELIENKRAPYDVRLVYLAVLNMFKHRGHFLNASLSTDDNGISMEENYNAFVEMAMELLDLEFPTGMGNEIEKVLCDRNLSRSGKAERLTDIFGFNQKMTDNDSKEKQKKLVALLKGICGLNVDAKFIFDDLETDEKVAICFADYSWEEKSAELLGLLGEERFSFIECMKQMYDMGSLANILKGKKYLSEARVEEYEKHGNDLKLLKQLYVDYKKEYDQMFRSEKAGSYSAYVNSFNSEKNNINKKPVRRNMKGRSREELYKTIKVTFEKIKDERIDYMLGEMAKETFLPKQLTAGNGIIPNQVHARELAAILKNAEGYLSFLSEKDASGLTISERIQKLFSFQIPYYIGPTTEKSSKDGGNGWVIRKEEGAVLPWNWEEKIDVEGTAQRFIERLIRNCTYLSDEKVLPKASLEYEKFCVLNEINKIKIAGEPISVELKQSIYKDLFCKGKKVTRKQLESYLINVGALDKNDPSQLSGIDQNINNSLTSYGKFYALFGEELGKDSVCQMAERIIWLCTVYGDSKSMLKKCIIKEFGDKLTDEQIKRISGFRFKDWGSLSKELLELPGCDNSTGEIIPLIRAMWETNYNFMELIHSDAFTFQDSLQDKQKNALKVLSDFEVEDLDEYYFSAPVKRMIWQTILVIREIEKVMGSAPKRVFIEMTRSDEEKGDKGRKDSRGKALLALYSTIKDGERDWKAEIETAADNGSLRSKKIYLYYTQMGRCMYSGEKIDLDDLRNDNLYDIDHIYPRHFVKDDSLSNNLVLVKKKINADDKGDAYPLPKLSQEAYDLWSRLLKMHFITEEKYRRLTGRNPFTEEQKAGFIARQLVETGQGTKGVADLLKQLLPDSTIVYSKGRNVSDFRKDFNLLKSRSVNEFHHAKDAYLNIVVGNVYFVKFTQDPLNYMRKLAKEKKELKYHLGKMFEKDVQRGDEVAWIASDEEKKKQGTIVTVKKMMDKNTPLMTRMNFIKHSGGKRKGGFWEETLHSAKKANEINYVPLKQDKRFDVTKYGGYSSAYVAYFFLVEHLKNNKRIRTIEALPIYCFKNETITDKELLNYCVEKMKLEKPSIRLGKIKVQSLICIDGFLYYLSGKTGPQLLLRNATNLCLNQYWINYIHLIDNYVVKGNLSSKLSKEKNEELYSLLVEKHLNGIYSKRKTPVGAKLQNGISIMKDLTLEQQCQLISEVLKLSSIGLTSADLKLINEKTVEIKCNYAISSMKECKLINQSVTGIYESAPIDLLTI
ncbi:MAG: type II CRISPR RNA-guided endonuclease Cas9 [Lachnospiraceae bacterium]|nr:type II CRISPR RNA-guided endonuclease Cas9 [Lachnospiraceae bacterium]